VSFSTKLAQLVKKFALEFFSPKFSLFPVQNASKFVGIKKIKILPIENYHITHPFMSGQSFWE
jgi:hypothetical protein